MSLPTICCRLCGGSCSHTRAARERNCAPVNVERRARRGTDLGALRDDAGADLEARHGKGVPRRCESLRVDVFLVDMLTVLWIEGLSMGAGAASDGMS